MGIVTYRQALHDTLIEEMRRDPNVVLMGEEIGKFEGSYKITAGLLKEFGPERVMDTPLSELLISGLCVGMAAQGLKPVGEIQFMGFIYPCIDQVVNHASRLRNRRANDR